MNFRTAIGSEIYQRGFPQKKLFLPKDNKVKDYLESAEEKFSHDCQDEEKNFYGILMINWQDDRFRNVPAVLLNKASGIFTEKSFVMEAGQIKQFKKVNGVVIYQSSPDAFLDFRSARKIFVQNPFTKPVDFEVLQSLFPCITDGSDFCQAEMEIIV